MRKADFTALTKKQVFSVKGGAGGQKRGVYQGKTSTGFMPHALQGNSF